MAEKKMSKSQERRLAMMDKGLVEIIEERIVRCCARAYGFGACHQIENNDREKRDTTKDLALAIQKAGYRKVKKIIEPISDIKIPVEEVDCFSCRARIIKKGTKIAILD